MSSPFVHHLRTTSLDATQQAAGLGDWQQDYEQISPGAFHGDVECATLGPVQVFCERASQKLLQVGVPRLGTLTLGLVQGEGAQPGWFCGQAVNGAQGFSVGGNQPFELVAPGGMALSGIAVDLAELARLGRQLRGPQFELRSLAPAVLQRPPPQWADIAALLAATLALAGSRPGHLRQPAALRSLVDGLGTVVLDVLVPEPASPGARPSAAARRRIVRLAREYMRAHVDEPVSVPALCEATSASRRNLQYAFAEALGMSPVAYLRVMRLNRVRRDLLREPAVPIGDVAARWGFWHLPRFAGDYRSFFGELPSATRMAARTARG
jgi:AraC family ethanolamine operon transcriptional activator